MPDARLERTRRAYDYAVGDVLTITINCGPVKLASARLDAQCQVITEAQIHGPLEPDDNNLWGV